MEYRDMSRQQLSDAIVAALVERLNGADANPAVRRAALTNLAMVGQDNDAAAAAMLAELDNTTGDAVMQVAIMDQLGLWLLHTQCAPKCKEATNERPL